MSHILVVDDVSVDRELAGDLLQAGRRHVEYACNGVEALEHLETTLPLAVVTDLQMPEMDGLQLVEAMREQYPNVPVIVMTAHGSEDLALQALLTGATDYVPKQQLANELVESVECVLTFAAGDRPRKRLAKCLCEQRVSYSLANDALLFAPLSEQCERIARDLRLVDEGQSRRLARALMEALRNAMYHGNLELPLEQIPELQQAECCDVVAKRCEEHPYRDRRIHFTATFTQEAAELHIRDDGPGFDVGSLPDVSTSPIHLSEGEGRGVVLMRMFMDEVRFSASGNEVKLIKLRTPDSK